MSAERRVIIVGSGPSGAMAALTLVRLGIPVTMLESGQELPSGLLIRAMGLNLYRQRPEIKNMEPFTSSGDPNTLWTNTLAPGGLSNHWTGTVPRFAPEDFLDGERLHEQYRWPISYEELSPYYTKAERLLSMVGDPRGVPNLPPPAVVRRRLLPTDWQHIASNAALLGYGLTSLPIADGPPWLMRRSGTAFNSYSQLVRRLIGHPNFHLILSAHVLRLEWSGQKRKVNSVIYLDRVKGTEHRIAAHSVMLSAGTLASTKILLNSSCSDFPTGLGDTEGLLGRYLHDHPHNWCILETDTPLSRLKHPAYLTRAPYKDSAPLLAASCTMGRSNGSIRERLLAVLPSKTTAFGVVIFGTMIPVRDNWVSLLPTLKDEFGYPRFDIHIRYDRETQQNITLARTRLVQVLESSGNHARIRWFVPELKPGASVHYGGTVRMHHSPTYGMLDRWNRMHAVSNVLVVDASCFTTCVEKNPTLTVMAIAARAASRLAESMKTS